MKIIDHTADVNQSVGGPIARDRLWFFGTYRKLAISRNSTWVPDADVNDWVYTPDASKEPQKDKRPAWNAVGRVTWQVSARHKVETLLSTAELCVCAFTLGDFSGQFGTPEAMLLQEFRDMPVTQVKWSAPMTSRLLVEAGGQFAHQEYAVRPPARVAYPGAIELSTRNVFRSLARIGATGQQWDYQDHRANHQFLRGSVAYVTGSHAFKAGLQLWPARVETTFNLPGGSPPYSLQLLNGNARNVTYKPHPMTVLAEGTLGGFFAQDQWTIRRFTVNAGVRIDTIDSSYPDMRLVATPILPARQVAGADVFRWRDLLPRLGVAYDLFGNGKTAIKSSANKYTSSPQHASWDTRTQALQAAGAFDLTRTWTDLNGDFVPEGDPLNPARHAELGPSPNLAFGQPRITTRYDPEVAMGGWGKRPYNWEMSAVIQHELAQGIALNVGYFRRTQGNLAVTDNLLVAPTDYDPFCVTVPVDARLPGGGGQQICGQYDLNPSKVGQQDNFSTSYAQRGVDEPSQQWNGVDVTVNARLRRGTIQGGWSGGKDVLDNCGVVRFDNPSTYLCHRELPVLHSVKAFAWYVLPAGVEVAATYQDDIGGAGRGGNNLGIQANVLYTNAQIKPSLVRDLSRRAEWHRVRERDRARNQVSHAAT